MAAMGPSFKKGFVDKAPAGNADLGKTIASILELDAPNNGELVGRVLSGEAFSTGATTRRASRSRSSAPSRARTACRR